MNINQAIMDNFICTQVLGMSYEDFIAAAKQRAGKDWNYIGWNDEMEAARDWLSVDALNALAEAEGDIAEALYSASNMLGKLTLPEAMVMAQEIIKDIKVPDKIWG